MKSDFEKLLSDCQNRVNEEKLKVIKVSNGNIVDERRTETNSSSSEEIRTGVKNIIEQKRREETKETAKILFSLKDFQKKKEVEDLKSEEEEKKTEVQDEVSDDDLDEDDESVRDVSFDSEENEDTKENEKSEENTSDIEEVEVVKKKTDNIAKAKAKDLDVPDDDDLESEIVKLDNLQKEVSESFKDLANRKPKPATVLLKMNDPVKKTKDLIKNLTRPGLSISKDTVKAEIKEKTEDKKKKEEVIDIEDVKEDEEAEVMKGNQRKTPSNLSQGTFKNISISVVGGSGSTASKNIKIQNIINSKVAGSAPEPSSAPSNSKVFNGPNISIKRNSSPTNPSSSDSKRFRGSAVVITPSSRRDAPTITLDSAGDDSEEEEEVPEENLSSSYDNCTHGDPLGYLCLDCIYNRWKTGFDFVKTRKEKPKKVEQNIEAENPPQAGGETAEVEPANIIKNVNWQQVFSFAGISVGQRNA